MKVVLAGEKRAKKWFAREHRLEENRRKEQERQARFKAECEQSDNALHQEILDYLEDKVINEADIDF